MSKSRELYSIADALYAASRSAEQRGDRRAAKRYAELADAAVMGANAIADGEAMPAAFTVSALA